MENNGTHDKAATIEQLTAAVVDPIHRRDDEVVGGPAIWSWLVQLSDAIVAPWWSRRRDMQLRNIALQSDFFQGAMYKVGAKLTDVPFRIVPRDPSIKSHRIQAEDFTAALVEGSELGQGWGTFLPKWLVSLWVQDNGAFAEIVGEGDPEGPVRGPALGVKVLDPARCNRTSNPEYPVVYTATSGKRFRYHHSRIMFTSQMPDPAEEMFNVGHCWLSRSINSVQNLIDIGIFKQEKLGSRPQRRMIIGKGVDALEIWTAFQRAEAQMDAQGLRRYAKNVVIGGLTKDDSIESIDLTSVNDLSDEKVMTDIGVYILAMTGGFPPRWIWPATTTGATKADADSQQMAGSGSGGQALSDIAYMLGGSARGYKHSVGKFLPPHLKMVFDYQDDQEDENQAKIRGLRSEYWDREVKSGIITVRVAREQMLEKGDITDSQFEDLELADGRLEDGSPIDVLFYSTDPVYRSLLGNIDPIEPDIQEITNSLSVARYVAVNPSNLAQKRVADICVRALEYMLNKAKTEALQLAARQALEQRQQQGELSPNEEENTEDEDNPNATKERSTYRLALVRNVQLLWEGRTTAYQFISAMTQAITNQFPEAWAIGSKVCGITTDELTEEEQEILASQIYENTSRLDGFAEFIVDHNRAAGSPLSMSLSRSELWLNSYDRVTEMAKGMACADQKLTWVLGATEKHCKSCLKMSGRVYRASIWNKNGTLPKSLNLACGGYRCDCKLVPTTKPITRGRPPKF